MVEAEGIEPTTSCLQSTRSPNWAMPPDYLKELVGLGGLEPPTSRLSGVRSNQLSYRPDLGFLLLKWKRNVDSECSQSVGTSKDAPESFGFASGTIKDDPMNRAQAWP